MGGKKFDGIFGKSFSWGWTGVFEVFFGDAQSDPSTSLRMTEFLFGTFLLDLWGCRGVEPTRSDGVAPTRAFPDGVWERGILRQTHSTSLRARLAAGGSG